MSVHAWSPVQFFGTAGKAPFVLICEHAAKHIPSEYQGLGLDNEARTSHAAWDIGAFSVATKLSKALDAPLVAGGVSRLVYDCNRPLEAQDAMPAKSEIFDIPGNEDLTESERGERHALVHEPFHCAVSELVRTHAKRCQQPLTILTIHSFTPVYNGEQRAIELGFLFDKNAAFSEAIQTVETERACYKTALNEPYDATDGVTYSLRRHAEAHDYHSTMIEIKNDLINTEEKAKDMSNHLTQSILRAHAALGAEREAS